MLDADKKKAARVDEHRATAKGTRTGTTKDRANRTLSTSAEAQRFRILDALRSGPQTSYDLRRMGCYQCPTRVFELRRAGHPITTTRVTLVDSDGYSHRGVALYELLHQHDEKAVQ